MFTFVWAANKKLGKYLLLLKRMYNTEGNKIYKVIYTTHFKTYLQEQEEEFPRQIAVLHLSQELHHTLHFPLIPWDFLIQSLILITVDKRQTKWLDILKNLLQWHEITSQCHIPVTWLSFFGWAWHLLHCQVRNCNQGQLHIHIHPHLHPPAWHTGVWGVKVLMMAPHETSTTARSPEMGCCWT